MLSFSDESWDDVPAAESRMPGRAEITAGLTPAQAAAAAHDGAILVLAGAGTGKTRTLASAAPGEEGGGRVQLMTLHKGKGLEFRHVFLPGWDQNNFPSTFGDPEEERRLAYVALTRGMERVSISHVEYRRGYTRLSPFLLDIPTASHVKGWLRSQRSDGGGPRRIGRHYVEDI